MITSRCVTENMIVDSSRVSDVVVSSSHFCRLGVMVCAGHLYRLRRVLVIVV